MASTARRASAFSSSTVDAPIDIGKSSRPPSPKVNASGGLPMNTSSRDARSTCARPAGAGAPSRRGGSASCAFGLPVVPDVNAIRQMSSAAVSTLSKRAGLPARGRSSRRLAVADAEVADVRERRTLRLRETPSSAPSSASHSAWLISRLRDDLGELLGAQQRHRRDGDAARLHHGEPAGREHRRVGAAQQHAVAGHQAHVLDQHAGDAIGLTLQLGVRPADTAPVTQSRSPSPAPTQRSSSSVAQLSCCGNRQLGQVEAELRLQHRPAADDRARRCRRARETVMGQSPANTGLDFDVKARYARPKSSVIMQIACACASASIAWSIAHRPFLMQHALGHARWRTSGRRRVRLPTRAAASPTASGVARRL